MDEREIKTVSLWRGSGEVVKVYYDNTYCGYVTETDEGWVAPDGTVHVNREKAIKYVAGNEEMRPVRKIFTDRNDDVDDP